MKKVAVVGLGYVGLPLAVAFGKKLPTIGFDLDKKKLTAYLSGKDPSGEVEPEDLACAPPAGVRARQDAIRLGGL